MAACHLLVTPFSGLRMQLKEVHPGFPFACFSACYIFSIISNIHYFFSFPGVPEYLSLVIFRRKTLTTPSKIRGELSPVRGTSRWSRGRV